MESRLLAQIKRDLNYSKKGLNKGLPWGLKAVDKHICGVQRGRYDVVFGEEGTGKTSFVDHCYVLYPMGWLGNNQNTPYRYTLFYYTLEIDPVVKLIKWACWLHQRRTNETYGINDVLAKGRHSTYNEKLANRILKNVEAIDKRIVKNHKHMQLRFQTTHKATTIVDNIRAYMLKNGAYKQDPYTQEKYYVPNNPFHVVQVIVDNAGNLDGRGQKKQVIDDFSAELIKLRNEFGVSTCLVMHANRAISANERGKSGEIFPKTADIKETHQTAQDANTVLALFNPYRHMNEKNNLGTFMGYPVQSLDNRFRVVGVLKNRDGPSDMRLPLVFSGPTGAFRNIPPPYALEQRPELIDNILNWQKYVPYGDLVQKRIKQTELEI